MEPQIRKLVLTVEEITSAAGLPVDPPARKAVGAAVIANPYAGRFVDDLEPLYDTGAIVGGLLAERLVAALGCEPNDVTAYGKGAIVGLDGELEHAAALLHPRFGAPVRKAVDHGAAIIPSTKKLGAPGASITVPITNKDDIWSFDEMDAAEITIPDAPAPGEIVIVLALALGGRPHARIRKDT
ncbi:MAG: amino acid synthesis family protein [Gaiella sp.]